ncbi:MAG: hypothetical protein AAGU21_03570 [Solidesulfovibrio sp.]|uniref:hypothetical protein n=1 Tax=Solidesulfovibrio sp. TaxID=2910990 RepID=UPI002B21F288|nr:hypothetical protein [Solidesulfovibrio sp.]MEA4855547.1 hypothetical protein [Solidesulfovibrio sp.]
MHDIDPRRVSREKDTMTCACGAVFTVATARQAGCDRLIVYACPACRRPHAAKACLPPELSLIIAPAALGTNARPAA